MARGRRLTDEQRSEICDLARAGQPQAAIAKRFGVTQQTVSHTLRAAGVTARERLQSALGDAADADLARFDDNLEDLQDVLKKLATHAKKYPQESELYLKCFDRAQRAFETRMRLNGVAPAASNAEWSGLCDLLGLAFEGNS